MKKNRRVTAIAILLVLVSLFFVFRNNSSRLRKEDRDFAVSDTASVTKIFLADRNNHTVILERKAPGEWMVNNKYIAQQQSVNFLLQCIRLLKVQTRVPKNSYNTVIKELSSTGIKCEIFTNNGEQATRVYYVGGSTMNVMGTYMMMENSTVPFVTEIPGFNGYLTPRYSCIERDWRIKKVVWLRPEEIQKVSIEYLFQPQNSYIIERNSDNWRVYSPAANLEIKHIDTLHLNNYITGFSQLNFEAWDHTFTDAQIDSLRKATPSTLLSVTDRKGVITTVPFYPKPVTATSLAQTDSTGKQLKYDIDRMYAFINSTSELVTIQYFAFNKIFASISDFDLGATRRKFKQ